MSEPVISKLLEPNRLPQKGVAIPKFDLRSIWKAVKFTPHSGQQEIFEGWVNHDVTTAVCGTRFGKSKLAAHLPLAYIAPCRRELIEDGRRTYVDHRTRGAVIAPYFRLTSIIMDLLYELVLKLCRLLGYPTGKSRRTKFYDVDDAIADSEADFEAEPGVISVRRVNGVIQTIVTPWGNRVDAFTMENPKGMLGQAFDFIITDESGQFATKEWSNFFEYADRARIDQEGWVYHGTTPKGFNELYDKFFVPGLPGPGRNGDYISFQMPTHRNTHLNPDYLEKMRKTTPPRLWSMNYLAEFTVLEGQVYEEFSRDNNVREFKTDTDWLYFLSMDFGFTDPFACQLMAWTGEAFAIIDEVYQPGLTTAVQKKLVMAMVNKHMPRGAQWLNQKEGRITTWGDPRGGQYRAEWAALGMPVRKPAVRIKGQRSEIEATSQIVAEYIHPVEDRRFPAWAQRPGDHLGSPALFVHARCAETIHTMLSWVKLENGYDGPDHLCFVAGTRIETRSGQQAIETLRVGQKVRTRKGWRRITAAQMTDASAEIWELRTSDGRTLRGTPNHPILVKGKGFVRMDALSQGDELICRDPKALFTKESASTVTQTQNGAQIASIFAQARSTFSKAFCLSTVKSMLTISARSPLAGMFTIGTAIPATTPPTTWRRCPLLTTGSFTPTQENPPATPNTLPVSENSQSYGTPARKGLLGMPRTQSRHMQSGSSSNISASSARLPTRLGTWATRDFAQTPASQSGGGLQDWTMKTALASFAKQCSALIATARPRPVRVLAAASSGEKCAVYNITVEDAHEYYAEGILVHNCDSLRYALLGARHFAVPLSVMRRRREAPPQPGKTGPGKLKVSRLTGKGENLNIGRR